MNKDISTSLKDVQKAAFAMRVHWGIENNLHWVLDAILDEDYCLVRKDNTAANLSVLRKIILNILKQVDSSDIVKAKKCGFSINSTYVTNEKIVLIEYNDCSAHAWHTCCMKHRYLPLKTQIQRYCLC